MRGRWQLPVASFRVGLGRAGDVSDGMSADPRAKALALASRLSSVLGKHPRTEPMWPVSDGSRHAERATRKVMIPKDDPSMNYFGLLCGPGGQTLKDMQATTGARIMIRGRGASRGQCLLLRPPADSVCLGSTKDGRDENPDEDMHVWIEGSTESQVAQAEQLVNDLLYNRDAQSRLKEQQLRTVAERKPEKLLLSERLYAPDLDYTPLRGSGGKSKTINVAINQVGLIIGRGGETIKMLQSKTGASIQVSREADPHSNMKMVTIEGSDSQIAHAEDEIMQMLHESEQREMARTQRRVGDQGGVGYGANGTLSVVIRIPTDSVGLLIGKGGMTIKTMQMRTACNIQVQRDVEADPSATTRDVTLSGTEQQIEDAKREICNLVSGLTGPAMDGQGGDVAIPGMAMITVTVPQSVVGGVIGRQGETIKAIQYKTGARVQVSRDTTQPEREITITGSDTGVALARAEIEQIARESQERDRGGGDRRRSYNDSYDYGDPYSRQAAMYGSDQYYAAPYGYPMAGYYGAGQAYPMPGYGYPPAALAPTEQPPQQQQATGEPAPVAPSSEAPAEGAAPKTEADMAAYQQQWHDYCAQYYAYYGQYPTPEAYAQMQQQQQQQAADGSQQGQYPAAEAYAAGQQQTVADPSQQGQPPAPTHDAAGAPPTHPSAMSADQQAQQQSYEAYQQYAMQAQQGHDHMAQQQGHYQQPPPPPPEEPAASEPAEEPNDAAAVAQTVAEPSEHVGLQPTVRWMTFRDCGS